MNPSKSSHSSPNICSKNNAKPRLKSIKNGCLSSSLPNASRQVSTELTVPKTVYSRSVSVQYDKNTRVSRDVSPEEHCGQRVRSYSVTSKGSIVKLADLRIDRGSNNSKESISVSPKNLSPQRASSFSSSSSVSSDIKINKCNVLIKGSYGVGKSTLAQLFMDFRNDTLSESDSQKHKRKAWIVVDGEHYEFTFHVTSHTKANPSHFNMEKFSALLLMYSVTDRESFETARNILTSVSCDYNKFAKLAIILVANKSDLVRSRVVSPTDGKFMAEAFQVKYIETSAEIDHNVVELLVGITKQIKLKREEHLKLASCETLRSSSFSSSSSSAVSATKSKRKSSIAHKLLSKILRKPKYKSCDNLLVP
ncbi:GTP-binding protein REM 1-like isoform X2 [Leptotrombidium deliense]|uniref:GTP-binding protein REM 1-like isoform X2 n=1 Tax=Leptotrombidium deliense TaxID=299467 RepID=A0A443SMG8_9ACAR|nr:GTP-binding protein REM 1-like isoform X2 [Leptotrombidium deliense]